MWKTVKRCGRCGDDLRDPAASGEHIAAVACATNLQGVGEGVHPGDPLETVGDKGVPQQRHALGSRGSNVHFGAGSRTAELERQSRGAGCPFMATGGGLVASTGKSYCGGAGNYWRAVSPRLPDRWIERSPTVLSERSS